MERSIRSNARRLCRSLRLWVAKNTVIDLRVAYLAWSADFITGVLFNSSLGLLEDYEEAETWHHDFSHFDKYFPILKQIPGLIKLGLRLP